jgi:hypothetical protein
MQRALYTATQLLLARVLASITAAGKAAERLAEQAAAADAAAEVTVAALDKGAPPASGHPGAAAPACSPAGPPSVAMPDAPEGDPSASSSASGGGGDARPSGLRPGPGSGAGGGAHGRSGAVDASVLHGMLEFFVALARAAGGGWASTEGAPVPVRRAFAARLAWTRAPS